MLIAGGVGASGVLASAEVFDPAAETSRRFPPRAPPSCRPRAPRRPPRRCPMVASSSPAVTPARRQRHERRRALERRGVRSGLGHVQRSARSRHHAAAEPTLVHGRDGAGQRPDPHRGRRRPCDYLASAELATLPPSCSPSASALAAGARSAQVALHCAGFAFAYAIVNGRPRIAGLIDQAHGTLTYTPNAGFAARTSSPGVERGRALCRGDRDSRGSVRAPIGLARERLSAWRVGLTADHVPRRVGDTMHRHGDVHDARDLPRIGAHRRRCAGGPGASPRRQR